MKQGVQIFSPTPLTSPPSPSQVVDLVWGSKGETPQGALMMGVSESATKAAAVVPPLLKVMREETGRKRRRRRRNRKHQGGCRFVYVSVSACKCVFLFFGTARRPFTPPPSYLLCRQAGVSVTQAGNEQLRTPLHEAVRTMTPRSFRVLFDVAQVCWGNSFQAAQT